MKKILGLDLGTNSIGWALIEVDENNRPIRIIAMGSRIIPLSSDDRDQFQKGQAISKNQDRTKMRTQRKGYDRKQLRKVELNQLLQELNIFPTTELMCLPSLDLWKLRADAASEFITAEQLGRILIMLNQKRGYKSARNENNDAKDTEYVAEVKNRYSVLKDQNQTIGQYFYNELNSSQKNNTYFHIKKKVYPREAYIDEFDTIIQKQKEKNNLLTDEVIEKLKNEIIFYQRNLKSQKGLVNICEFEGFKTTYFDKKQDKERTIFTGPKVAPKSSPLFQLCKIWETVNNLSIKIKNPEGSGYKWDTKIPTLEEKFLITDVLNKNANLSFTELLKIMKLKKEDVYANKQILKGLQGNITYAEINKYLTECPLLQFNLSTIPSQHTALLIDKKTGEILTEEKGLQIDSKIEQEPLYQLWHTIYSIKELDECKLALIKRFQLNEETADKLSKIDFNKQSFGNKSNKAIRKILPYLMLGYNYSDACCLAGYNHSNSLTKEETLSQVMKDKLELLQKNSLRQPIVEKIINQMINVVNAIIYKYSDKDENGKIIQCFKFDEIRIELARELKQSKEERNDTDSQISANKKINDEVVERLRELGLPTTKRIIQKYKFIFPIKDKKYKDAQVANQCIYCGKSFNLTDALNGDDFDVDHIVPRALLFDDSQTNKVLVHSHCNANKKNQTAYDYISNKGDSELNNYLIRVDEWFKRGIISFAKMQRLKVSYEAYKERKKLKKETEADKKLWETFIDRQLRETQYIARKSKEILQQICNNITSTEGTVTAKLRKLWGWDDVLMNLQIPKYKEIGQTVLKEWQSDHGKRTHQKEEIENWSKRDDHRHHAIDALVIACTQQGFIQRINTLNADDVKDEMNKQIEESRIIFKEKFSLLEKYLISKRPFDTSEIEKEADKILVSFKAGKKIASVSKYKAKGKNEITGVLVPRGPLHEQFVYGKIKVLELENGKPKKHKLKYIFENSDLIFKQKIKQLVKDRLLLHNNDSQKALSSLKENPIYLDENKTIVLEYASCLKDEIVYKYLLGAGTGFLFDGKEDEPKAKKILDSIIDKGIQNKIKERLWVNNQFVKPKDAFKDLENNPVYLNTEKKILIKTVRCMTGLTAVMPVKKNSAGKDIGFAKTGSNHHIAIYRNKEEKLVQHLCTFWHAVERKKYKIPCIIKNSKELWDSILNEEFPQSFLDQLPEDNLKLEFSLQQNEMFILGLPKEDFEKALHENNKSLLSKYLYLVWSISDNNYWFRHHLETKNSELKGIKGVAENKRFYNIRSIGALFKLNPIKVRLNHLGEITKVGEY